jgi:hypothetical protein
MYPNKEKLQNHYKTLQGSYSEYMKGFQRWKRTKNKQKKGDAFEVSDRLLINVKSIIESEPLLFDLTSKPVNYYENLVSFHYFHKEMPSYLKKVQEAISRIH